MLGTLTTGKKKPWPKYIADLVEAYNLETHWSTEYSPYFMIFGHQPRLSIDVMEIILEGAADNFIKSQQEILWTVYDTASRKIRKAGQTQKKYYDKGCAESNRSPCTWD